MSTDGAGRPRVAVSACILGQRVRFDGSASRPSSVVDDLGDHAELISMCPEIGAGMPVPRETVRLVQRPGRSTPSLVSRSGVDWTAEMERFADVKLDELERLELCGLVVKSRSPSCGLERVRVYGEADGPPRKDGVGAFTRRVRERFPALPIEEDGRLSDRALRENFLEAVFAYARWRAFVAAGPGLADLVAYQRDNKYLLHSHSPARQAELGRLVAGGAGGDRAALLARYGELHMRCLGRRARIRDHVHTLRRIAGHLRRAVSPRSSGELDAAIDDYRGGRLPRAVPLALVKHHAVEREIDYLAAQTYLTPYPVALMRA